MNEFALDDPSFYEDFLVEAQEHFEQIESNFLALESNPEDLDLLNAIFRSVHTIKGASGFLGLHKVQGLSHIGENILDDLRKGRMTLTPETMELLFETTDMLKVLVEDVRVMLRKQGEATDPDTSHLIARLEAVRSGGASTGASTQTAAAPQVKSLDLPPMLQGLDSHSREVIANSLSSGQDVLAIAVDFDFAVFQSHFNPFSVWHMAELVGHPLAFQAVPKDPEMDLDAFSADFFPLRFILLIQPTESLETSKKLLGNIANAKVEFIHLTPGALAAASAPSPAPIPSPVPPSSSTPPPLPPQPEVKAEKPPVSEALSATGPGPSARAEMTAKDPARKAAEDSKAGSDTVRVSQAKLDEFMNIVAELIISKTMISHLVERLSLTVDGPAAEITKELSHASLYLDRVSKEIQASVLGIRMVPIKTVFVKFPRMLRDLARASGKKIELIMVGEDTEIDKTIVEELADPLIHLIRNSADHGVEMPEARSSRGKSEQGTVWLRARHEGDNVVVEIEDDGKGIDPKIIGAKALEKGLVTQERLDQMTPEEIVDMIFLPGFSTAAKITDISGRGVGMDVVRNNVRKLNGTCSVTSVVGKGSVFTIRLPLTLAIIDALLVRSGGQVFALPGSSVEETLAVSPSQMAFLTRRKAINLRGEVLGVVRLQELLRASCPIDHERERREGLSIVVAAAGGRRMGLIVDDFVRRQEVVIKPLASYLANLPGISGASIMGDGGVVLILDPVELMDMAIQEAH